MKTAVGFVFMAALGTALPHVGRSTTTCGSSNTNAANESKLPWVEPKNENDSCNIAIQTTAPREIIEEACGTEDFCDLFNPEYGQESLKGLSAQYGYANNKECLAAHDPKPTATTQEAPNNQPEPSKKLPWIEYKGDFSSCFHASGTSAPREIFEEACGTENFCDFFNPEYGQESLKGLSAQYGYANNKECLAAHDSKPTATTQEAPNNQPEPSKKLPWIEYKGDFSSCFHASGTSAPREIFEEACGTENFCDFFNPEYNIKSLKQLSAQYGYANNKECLAAHDSKP